MNLVHYQYAELRHCNAIESLASKLFGKWYMTSDQIAQLITSENHFLVIALRVEEVLGFIYFITGDVPMISGALKISALKFLSELSSERSYCLIKTIAVEPSAARRGIGTGLTRFALDQHKNVEILSVVWKRESVNAFEQIILKLGSKVLLEIKEYWKIDSQIRGYNCPECGTPPCHCSAIVYIKRNMD